MKAPKELSDRTPPQFEHPGTYWYKNTAIGIPIAIASIVKEALVSHGISPEVAEAVRIGLYVSQIPSFLKHKKAWERFDRDEWLVHLENIGIISGKNNARNRSQSVTEKAARYSNTEPEPGPKWAPERPQLIKAFTPPLVVCLCASLVSTIVKETTGNPYLAITSGSLTGISINYLRNEAAAEYDSPHYYIWCQENGVSRDDIWRESEELTTLGKITAQINQAGSDFVGAMTISLMEVQQAVTQVLNTLV